MSSPPKEKVETKGGHAPAVKAGGMRIVQKHQSAAVPEPPQKDDNEEYVSSSPPKAPVIVSGVVTKVYSLSCCSLDRNTGSHLTNRNSAHTTKQDDLYLANHRGLHRTEDRRSPLKKKFLFQ
uniref:Death-associated protein n=1 Tax=Lates calcarifer TaxID=8187 RepID=A0A4W6FV34_LATCA